MLYRVKYLWWYIVVLWHTIILNLVIKLSGPKSDIAGKNNNNQYVPLTLLVQGFTYTGNRSIHVLDDPDTLQPSQSGVIRISDSKSFSWINIKVIGSLYFHNQLPNHENLPKTKYINMTNKSDIIRWHEKLCAHRDIFWVLMTLSLKKNQE